MEKTLGKPKPQKETKEKRVNKKSARKKLVLNLDALCRQIVLERDGHCVCPPPNNGHSDVRQCGHLITRSKESVRWDLYNTNEQCSSCNMVHEFHPHRYTNWFITTFGDVQYHLLCERAEKVQKLQLYELEELHEQMKKIREKQLVCSLSGEPFKPHFTQADILSGAWSKS